MKTLASLLLLLPLLANAASVYQCADANGNPIFSQSPCAPSALQIDIQPPQTTGVSFATSAIEKAQVDAAAAAQKTNDHNYRITQKVKAAQKLQAQQAADRDRFYSYARSQLNHGNMAGYIANKNRAEQAAAKVENTAQTVRNLQQLYQ